MKKLRLNINGKEVTGFSGQTILSVAKENDINIPTLCFDERTDIYGSCGLCMVEIEGFPKIMKSCATEISDGMVIRTDTEKVKESRKTNLELLLTQHIGDCRPPCTIACPGETDCQGYVGLIANGEYKEALKLIKEQLPLPAAIGRVCPHPCEDACRRQLVDDPISIAQLKFFAAEQDYASDDIFMPELAKDSGKKVAVIGGGPAGLSAAYFLKQKGHDITIYDAMPKLGGMLRYGIPEYRLPQDVLDEEISTIIELGIKTELGVQIGKDIAFDKIKADFDAVYVAIGAWTSSDLRCNGEDLEGVYGGIHFLRKVVRNEEIKLGDKVAIVGGGNTAMDACRTAVRLGVKEVYNIYRRTRDEMPAEEIEIVEGEEEGVIFKYLVNPIEIVGDEDGKVSKIRLQKMALGEPDASGRRKPIPIEGEEEILEVDNVIAAIGQGIDSSGFEQIDQSKWNGILADTETFMTNVDGVFAGGDCMNDEISIAIKAIGDARRAAEIIDGYLNGEEVKYEKPYRVIREDLTPEDFDDRERAMRSTMDHLSADERKDNFEEVMKGYTEEEAQAESDRCLECGCHDFYECKLVKLANDYDVEVDRFEEEEEVIEIVDDHPFILRDSNKCILCGLCVRVCDQVMGVGALGLVDRGYDAIVKPTLEKPLAESGCVSCGQCVSVCPTGALAEKLSIKKSVPVDFDTVKSTCSFCSVGCSVDYTAKGDMLLRALPDSEGVVNKGLLCAKGRFGYDPERVEGRITQPMIKKEGKLVEVPWYEAYTFAAKKIESSVIRNGKDSVAVAISPKYTNEEIFAYKQLASLVGAVPFSFENKASGLVEVLGTDASPNTMDELMSANVILTVGFNPAGNPVAGLKMKQATENGAKLVAIAPAGIPPMPYASKVVMPENDLGILNQIIKAMVDMGAEPKNAEGFDALVASLEKVTVSDDAKEIAEMYMNAKKALIVFGQSMVSVEASKAIANMAVVSGHIGSAREGIIQIKSKNNSQGLIDLGITKTAADVADAKAMFIFGEDVNLDRDNMEFVMVQDTHLTETAMKADVVFPAESNVNVDGTFTNTERRIVAVNKVVNAPQGISNIEIVASIAKALENNIGFENTSDVVSIMSEQLEYYRNAVVDEVIGGVLYQDGFNFEDGKAKLAVTEGQLFAPMANADFLMNQIAKDLPKPPPPRKF